MATDRAAPPATPTLDRRNAVAPDSQKIGQFLDWLQEQGIVLGKWGFETFSKERRLVPERFRGPDWFDLPFPRPSYRDWNREQVSYPGTEDRVIPTGESIDALLHRYFDIDPKAEEDELQAVLEYVRSIP